MKILDMDAAAIKAIPDNDPMIRYLAQGSGLAEDVSEALENDKAKLEVVRQRVLALPVVPPLETIKWAGVTHCEGLIYTDLNGSPESTYLKSPME
jgi:hypothetical protein